MRAWVLLPAAALLLRPGEHGPIINGSSLAQHRREDPVILEHQQLRPTRRRSTSAPDAPAATGAEYEYQLQYVALNLEDMRPRSPYNPKADMCLTSLGVDELGGAGLGFGKCAHYGDMDEAGKPIGSTEKPAEGSLFNLLPDGRLQNKITGWCMRRVKCHSQYVYDLGTCEQPAVSIFNLWKARSNQADVVEYMGLPLTGVDGPCSSCGPYMMKQLCGTAETEASCGSEATSSVGWTRDRVQRLPEPDEHRYTLAFAPAPRPLCGTRIQQTEPSPLEGMNDPAPPWYYLHKYKDGKMA